MDATKLRETLAQIHQELATTPHADAQSREILVQILHDVERLLSNDPDRSTAHGWQTTLAQLQNSVQEWEVSHPFLATLIGRIADGLSSMGI